MSRIRISWSGGQISAQLRDTPTTQKLVQALPYENSANVWGDECRLISDANIMGQIEGDSTVLKSVRSGDTVRLELES